MDPLTGQNGLNQSISSQKMRETNTPDEPPTLEKERALSNRYLEVVKNLTLNQINDEAFLNATWELSDQDFIIAAHVTYLKYYPSDKLIAQSIPYIEADNRERKRFIQGFRNWATRQAGEAEKQLTLLEKLKFPNGITRTGIMITSLLFSLMVGIIALSGLKDIAIVLILIAILMALLIVTVYWLLKTSF